MTMKLQSWIEAFELWQENIWSSIIGDAV